MVIHDYTLPRVIIDENRVLKDLVGDMVIEPFLMQVSRRRIARYPGVACCFPW